MKSQYFFAFLFYPLQNVAVVIKVVDISKAYKNKILDKINLTVEPGNICCVLGKNGVGKSTLLGIITQTTKQDSGEIIINNRVFNGSSTSVKEKMGILSQNDDLINPLTGWQFLQFQCLIFGMQQATINERIKSLAAYFFEDSEDILKSISSYSSGMRMKLKIIASLIHNPKILILDEPFASLDPIAAEKLVVLLNQFINKGDKVVLISSHDLMYVEKIASQICVLENKKVAFDGSKDDFTRRNTSSLDKTLLALINTEVICTESLGWLL